RRTASTRPRASSSALGRAPFGQPGPAACDVGLELGGELLALVDLGPGAGDPLAHLGELRLERVGDGLEVGQPQPSPAELVDLRPVLQDLTDRRGREAEALQAAHPLDPLEVAVVVGAVVAARAPRAEEPELLVVLDRARRDAQPLRRFADAQTCRS